MLQQTQVDTVLPYFDRFMARFPAVEDLAAAPLDEVLSLWSGLGYYSRARNMHKAAKAVAIDGSFPLDIKGLRAMPGVGEYMAAAIASIALGQDEATVDGNIARVMSRIHADAGPRKAMWGHARAHLPRGRAGDYNQALMDLGARICRPKRANCSACPVQVHCQAHADGTVGQFPPPKARRKAPRRQLHAVWFEEDETVLLARRPAEGLWGGLWELPSVVSAGEEWKPGELAGRWAETYSQGLDDGEVLLQRRHVLTHKVFDVTFTSGGTHPPVSSRDHTALRWVDRGSIGALGLSALTAQAIKSVWG
jgi:A/G-specific adenine glycosylase